MTEPFVDDLTKGRRELKARLIATPIILLVLGAVLWIHDATGVATGTYLLVAAFGAAAGAEMALLFKRAGKPARPLEAAIWCGLLCLTSLPESLWPRETWVYMVDPTVMEVLLLALIVVLVRHLTDTRPQAIESIAVRWIPIVFVGFLFSYTAQFAPDARLILWFVLTAKASDMVGWAVGVPLGRHKMIPSVSPGKSWEGTVAGVAASVLVAIFLPAVLDVGGSIAHMSTLELAGFGLLVGASSVLAGVLWSGWKRRLDAKDSSALIPAMGGIMDMVDSLLLAGPVGLTYLMIVNRLSWPL